jgi:hypothetical protein
MSTIIRGAGFSLLRTLVRSFKRVFALGKLEVIPQRGCL